jgi:lysophospholipase L1-like esterase
MFQALDALENGTASGPVAILQIGDSHTANDAFSSRMRSLMQSRFGDAGRGMLPPGIPFRLYHPAQVVVTASGWQSIGSLQTSNLGPFGLAGVRQTAVGLAEMTLSGEPPNSFDEVLIEALGQPGGGTIDVTTGNGPALTLPTDAASDTPLWLSVQTGLGKLVLHAGGDGPTTVLSWTAMKHRPGVTWSNLGTIGATIDTLGRFDPNLVKAELDHLQPVLILIAFGTNEGFDDTTDPAAYEARYAASLRMLHEAAPRAAILVVGAPDGSRKGSATAKCPTPGSASPGWSAPPRLDELREAQRRVARAEGSYFWDWSTAMGGACSMQVWARTNPPMAAADHVHLLTPGYRVTADKLFEELMRHYDRYREAAHPG